MSELDQPARFLTDWGVSARLPCYTRANASEVLADPVSPLGWSLVFEKGLLKGWRSGLVEFGVYEESELDEDRPPVVGMFGGYFYLNLSHLRLTALRMGSSPEALDAAFVGKHPDVPPYCRHPDDESPGCSARIAATMAWVTDAAAFPEIDEDRAAAGAARLHRPDLRALGDAELVGRMRSFLPELARAFHQHVRSGLAATVGPQLLGGLLTEIGRPRLLLDLLSGLGEVDSAEPSTALWRLARAIAGSAGLSALMDAGLGPFAEALAQARTNTEAAGFAAGFRTFLADFGCRGPNEWDICAPSWEARPGLALALLDRLRQADEDESPRRRIDRLRRLRQTATDTVGALLDGRTDLLTRFEAATRTARVFLPARERTKTTAVTLINEVRMAALELGRRGAEAGHLTDPAQVMMLLEAELDDYVAAPGAFDRQLAGRLAEYRGLYRLDPPFILAEHVVPLHRWPRRDEATHPPALVGDTLAGVPGSAGTHHGRVRVLTDLADPSALQPGEVLVTGQLDAAWTPLLLVAGAVVADIGATNSHAAVICRELGLPCVLSAAEASRRLRDGMLVLVDGTAGTVTVDAAPSAGSVEHTAANAWYDRFLPVNLRLRDVCTRWQCRENGSPNDHRDAAYDRRVLEDLHAVHAAIGPVVRGLAETFPSLNSHLTDLETALRLFTEGDHAWLTSPRRDSYHTVWMRLHQEMLNALGISRAEDAAREERLTPEPEPARPVSLRRARPLVRGLPAAPGAGSGYLVLSGDRALRRAEAGDAVVLVAETTTPADLPAMLAAAALVTSRGGSASHAAVVARGAGIPAVCGARELRVDVSAGTISAAGRTVREGELVSVDGDTGEVHLGVCQSRRPETAQPAAGGIGRPGRLGVRANADSARDLRVALDRGAEGVGLCRTEHQFTGAALPLIRQVLAGPDSATLDELCDAQRSAFRELFEVAGDRPVTVRLLDAPTHEFLAANEPGAYRETNPMLGVRGVRLAVLHERIYPVQATAMFLAWGDVAATGPAPALEILVPLVSLPEELEWVAASVACTAAQVQRRTGTAVPYRIGCMIETPRAALLADRLATTAEFLSFGTNDLTQFTYGFSRDDVESTVLAPYRQLGLLAESPFVGLDLDGVGALIEIAVHKARSVRTDVTLGICGEQAAEPAAIAWCESQGLDYVSCSPYRVPQARRAAATTASW